MARAIGDDACGLAYDTDARREPARDLRVLMRPVGVVVLERAFGRHQVPADEVGEVTGQRTKLFQDFLVEFVRGDVGRDLGQPLALWRLGLAIGPAVPGSGSGALLTVVAGERPVTARAAVAASAVAALTPFPITAATGAAIVPLPERPTTVIVTTGTTVVSTLTARTVTALATRTTVIPVSE
ncbi:hypothetical protein [Nonomuraea sp. KM88]|uniref:hypothetical protein n=1 Tax=Nonomuraea sp. KM88 TaxID=3457427 RepID=UPI003FCE7FAE